MISIEDMNEHYMNNGVKKRDLMKCSVLIDSYLDYMIKKYMMDLDKETREEMSECIYLTLLSHIKEQSENGNEQVSISSEFYGVLDDFESEDRDRAIGNMMILIGKSGTNKDTRHEDLTRLASRISQNFDEESNI